MGERGQPFLGSSSSCLFLSSSESFSLGSSMKCSMAGVVPIRGSGSRFSERRRLKISTGRHKAWKSYMDFLCLVDAYPQRPRNAGSQHTHSYVAPSFAILGTPSLAQ